MRTCVIQLEIDVMGVRHDTQSFLSQIDLETGSRIESRAR